MDRPDAAAVKLVLPTVPWAELGFTDDAVLDPLVEMANAYVEAVTGRLLDASMPTTLDDLALQAVALRTAQNIYDFQGDRIEDLTDAGIVSFSVPGYSETRRDPTSTFKASMINSWPMLNELLWLLATDEMRDEWLETFAGGVRPAFAYEEVDWGVATFFRQLEDR